MNQTTQWTPESWRKRPAKQQPSYDDEGALNHCLKEIKSYPPLVFAGEVENLKKQLVQAQRGQAFLLQGGDCAESFADCKGPIIVRKLKIMLQMSVILSYGARKPVIRVGRIAGQYAKPRSQDHETIEGTTLPVFRGDNVNSFEASLPARRPDPTRLLSSYHYSALTLNYIRALTRGGFADLHNPQQWDLDFVMRSKDRERYKKIVENINDAIAFMESLGSREDRLNWVEYYTSHEGLLLPYEEAQTHFVREKDSYYNLGAHMLWIGDRTRQLDGAHIEYCRGIANPIGLKVGPNADPAEIVAVVKALNPTQAEGKVVLISRFGAGKVKSGLAKHIQAIQGAQQKVLWSVDPMHGNAIKTENGIKTRNFDQILQELKETDAIHKEQGSLLAGVHFELTGENVTECIGGSQDIRLEDLESNYASYCDPRLNYSQSLEMAFLLSAMMSQER